MYRKLLISVGAVVLLLAQAVSANPLTPASANTRDTYRSRQWGLDKIQAEEAWPTAAGGGAIIAIVDTGVDMTHEDLASKILYYSDADFVEPRGTCITRRRRKVCRQDGAQDKDGHGTMVAGIAGAATNNGLGIAGVAPDAVILPVRVLPGGGRDGSTHDVAAGIVYAADKGAHVINLSLAYDQMSDPLANPQPIHDAIDYAWEKGAVIVVAAGNAAVPACAEPSAHPRALCVGATDPQDLRSYYSNSDPGAQQWFMVAPGGAGVQCSGDIISTTLATKSGSGCSTTTGYEVSSGTSLAAPAVSGAAAMLAGHGLTNDVIVNCLLDNADDLGTPGTDSIYGSGRLNAARAVTACV